MTNYNWDALLQNGNVDEVTESWTATFLQLTEKSVPHMNITVRSREKDFITPEIKRLIRARNRAFNIYKQNCTQLLWGRYKVARNKVTSKIKQAKKKEILLQNEYFELNNIFKKVLGKSYRIIKINESNVKPVVIDIVKSTITIFNRSPIFPNKTRERKMYEKLLIFYEIATINARDKNKVDDIFYKLFGVSCSFEIPIPIFSHLPGT